MNKLQELRQKLKNQNTNNYGGGSSNSTIFSFKDLQVGDSIYVRFIQDKEENDYFWRERSTRQLPFTSIKQADGTVEFTNFTVTVPAFNLKSNETNQGNLPNEYLYRSTEDVIQQEIKDLYDQGEAGQALYKKYARKTTYLMQGFVHDGRYQKQIYRFVIFNDLYSKIYSFLSDNEIEELPTDAINGRDFIINVTQKGQYKDYTTSKWSSKVLPLTDEENQIIANGGSYVLKDWLPLRPTPQQEIVMLEMYNASVNGEPYDVTKWGKVFKPDYIKLTENGMMEQHGKHIIPTEIQNNTVGQTVQPIAQQVVQQTVAQPVQQTVAQPVQTVAQPVQTVAQPVQQIETVQQPVAQPVQQMVQTVVQENQPVHQTTTQMINEQTEVVTTNPAEAVANILNRINQGN